MHRIPFQRHSSFVEPNPPSPPWQSCGLCSTISHFVTRKYKTLYRCVNRLLSPNGFRSIPETRHAWSSPPNAVPPSLEAWILARQSDQAKAGNGFPQICGVDPEIGWELGGHWGGFRNRFTAVVMSSQLSCRFLMSS